MGIHVTGPNDFESYRFCQFQYLFISLRLVQACEFSWATWMCACVCVCVSCLRTQSNHMQRRNHFFDSVSYCWILSFSG